MAIILTQILAFICIGILPHNLKYRRFTPLNFGFGFAILYSGLLFTITYIDEILTVLFSSWNVEDLQIPKYVIAIWSLAAITLYSIDILNIYIEKIVLMAILSVTFAITLLAMDLFIF